MVEDVNWLGEEDSNLYQRLQRPLSCHWTIPQNVDLQRFMINAPAQNSRGLKGNHLPGIDN